MAITYQQKKEREEQVLDMISKGMSISQMAVEIGITQQSMHKFLKVRGWRTHHHKSHGKGTPTPEEMAEKERRKAERLSMKKPVDRR